ncbi:TRAP transporter small permease [Chloroflexota bacterium]
MSSFTKAFEWLCKQLGWIAGSLAAVMMLFICTEIFRRYVLRDPTMWTHELMGYLLVGIVYLGAGWTAMRNRHVRVDLIYNMFSDRGRKILDTVMCLAAIAYCVIFTWQGADQALNSLAWGICSAQERWPLFFPHLLVPIGGLFTLLVFVIKLVSLFTKRDGTTEALEKVY